MKLLFLDTETTGVDVQKHGIIQVSGIIDIDGEIAEEFDFRCKPFPSKIYDNKALEINGVSKEQIGGFPDPRETYKSLIKILEKYINRYNKNDKFYLVGQNIKFDYDFMRQWFEDNSNKYFYAYVFYHLIDLIVATTLFKASGYFNPKNAKLQTVADCFNIEFKAHDSLEDIRVTRQLFYKFINLIKTIEKQNKGE